MDALDRVTDEFRRLDDELAVGVTLPSVDEVIRRAGALARTSTAAAAAVLTVGALGGVTAVAQVAAPETVDTSDIVAASLGDQRVPVLPAELEESADDRIETVEDESPVRRRPAQPEAPATTTSETPPPVVASPPVDETPSTTATPRPTPTGGSEGDEDETDDPPVTTDPDDEDPPVTGPSETTDPPVTDPTATGDPGEPSDNDGDPDSDDNSDGPDDPRTEPGRGFPFN